MKTMMDIEFHAARLPGREAAILGPSGCGNDVVEIQDLTIDVPSILVKITLEETDPRVSKVLTLLDQYGEERWVSRWDVYTEDELQSAPLLILGLTGATASGGQEYGTTYDTSPACPKCGTGTRQTSALNIDRSDLNEIAKFRVAGTTDGERLVLDVDVERLLAAGVTGALFWPVYAKSKGGDLEELRHQQLFIEHVMPPMSLKSSLNRTKACPDCGRGWYTHMMNEPIRFVYRGEDLANIQDFNLTSEWFGEPPHFCEPLNAVVQGPRHPWVLVTPKVMNLLRGKTKKEQKYQGCGFAPIWIEDDSHDKPYLMT